MAAAIIILAVLFVAETAFIFWLLKVLKNTFDIVEGMIALDQGKTPRLFKEAYDGKYYPATVIARVIYNAPEETKIVDWSLYESRKIIGFTVTTPEPFEDYFSKDELITKLGVTKEDLMNNEELYKMIEHQVNKPVVIKNALVYAFAEGEWTWKLEE